MQTQRSVDPDRRLRMQLRRQIEWGRWALLVIVAVTFLNQLLLWFGVEYHLLFSASMPYYLNWLAGQLGGTGLKVLSTLLTLLLYCAYGACLLMSGFRREWMVASIGLYGVDTLVLIIFAFTMLANPASCILEILTHAAAIVPMFYACQAFERLERLPRVRRRPVEQ